MEKNEEEEANAKKIAWRKKFMNININILRIYRKKKVREKIKKRRKGKSYDCKFGGISVQININISI